MTKSKTKTPSPSLSDSKQGSKGSKGTKGTRKGVAHTVRHMVRRKNCMYCFVISVVLLAVFIAASIFLTVMSTRNWSRIAEYKRKQSNLEKRTDFTAFYEIVCPIPGNKTMNESWHHWDTTFCNRYCGRNDAFEFMFRQIDMFTNDTPRPIQRSEKHEEHYECPIYIELRQCQEPEVRDPGYCEQQEFEEDYISMDMSHDNQTQMELGICLPCSSMPQT